jgi:hypothetical protein
MVVTIEHLMVLFDAERARDAAVFASLFDDHMARHEADRQRDRSDAAQADCDRSLAPRSTW